MTETAYRHRGVSAPSRPAIVSWPGLVFVSSYRLLFPWSQVQHGTEGQQCCWEPSDLCIAEWEQQVQVRGLWVGYYMFVCVWEKCVLVTAPPCKHKCVCVSKRLHEGQPKAPCRVPLSICLGKTPFVWCKHAWKSIQPVKIIPGSERRRHLFTAGADWLKRDTDSCDPIMKLCIFEYYFCRSDSKQVVRFHKH